MFTFVLCSGSRLQRYNLAQAMSSISLYFFIFSILFFNFALATVRNAPTWNTLPWSCAIKREWGESPQLSRSCEPPLYTGANERTTEATHLFAECVGMARMPYPPMLWEGVRVWVVSQKTCLKHPTWILLKECHQHAPRGLGEYGNRKTMYGK